MTGLRPIHWAASEGHVRCLERLLELGVDRDPRDKSGMTPLLCGAWYGHLDVVRYLVEEAGADPRLRADQGATPLDTAACAGDLEVVRYLIEERGMDPTKVNKQVRR